MKDKKNWRDIGPLAVCTVLLGLLAIPASGLAARKDRNPPPPPPSYNFLEGAVSGEAYSVYIDLNTANLVKVKVGPIPHVVLPAKGGFVSDSLSALNVADILTSNTMVNATAGGVGTKKAGSVSYSTIEKLDILGLIKADLLTSECSSYADGTIAAVDGTGSLVNLKINGKTIDASTPDNTGVDLFDGGVLGGILGGLGTKIGHVIINERIDGGDGVKTAETTRNVLHVILDTNLFGALDITDGDIIVSSAHCDVDAEMITDTNPPPNDASGFITGGGRISSDAGFATFGFNARPGQGQLQYNDHGTGLNVHGYDVTEFAVSEVCATWKGPAKVNGVDGYNFTATACDNGEPGKDADKFSIDVSDGYGNSDKTLQGGNIQLH
ncbi:MAG: choice-of-anchor P family protein [Gammaproteobacteria bacterium]